MNPPSLALLASPLLWPVGLGRGAPPQSARRWRALTCAASGPVHTAADVLDAFLATLPPEEDLVLVPHSNAGAYVPELTRQRRVVATVFVDAVLPPAQGQIPLAPPAFLDPLRQKADASAMLPVWTNW